MLTRNEYHERINSPTEENMEEVLDQEGYIKHSMEYLPYLGPFNIDVLTSYEKEIAFLNSLNERNNNQNEALKRGNELTKIIPLKERRETQIKESEALEEHLQLVKQKRAGYLNASILLFVVLNLGLFLASLLIILK